MKNAIVGSQSRLTTYNIIRMRDDGMEPIEPLSNNPAGPFPHGHASAQHCTGCPCAKREPPVIVGVLCRNEKACVTHMPVCLPVVCGSVRARAYTAPKKQIPHSHKTCEVGTAKTTSIYFPVLIHEPVWENKKLGILGIRIF